MTPDVFKQPQTKEIIQFVREQYGDELEFLWPKFDTNAIWRHPVTKKWYAALLTVEGEKLGLSTKEKLEVLDLRFDKGEALDFAASTPGIYPGWHMNKKSWITVVLDGQLSTDQVEALLDHSYMLASGRS